MKIEDMNFSLRTYNCLKRAGINTVEQIKEMSGDELLKIRNMGTKQVTEIVDKVFPEKTDDKAVDAMTGLEWLRSLGEVKMAWFLTYLIATIGPAIPKEYVDDDIERLRECLMLFLTTPTGENWAETLKKLEG